MSIVKMKKLSLIAVEPEQESLLKELMVLGCVEVSTSAVPMDDSVLTRYYTGGTEQLRSVRSAIFSAAGILDEYSAPPKTKMFVPGPDVDVEEFLSGGEVETHPAVARDIEEINASIRGINMEIAREEALIESLRPWSRYGLPLNCEGTKSSFAIIGTVPAATDVRRMSEELGEAIPEAEIFGVSEDGNQQYLSVICLRERQQELSDALRVWGFNPSQLSAREGTGSENIECAERHISDLCGERERLEAAIRAYSVKRAALLRSVDFLDTEIARVEASEKLLASEKTVALSGWVPAPEVGTLESKLAQYNCAWELSDPSPDEYPDVPVRLKNNALTEPLNMVTEMYSLPAYDGVDPNPLLLVPFVLFYGAMMADVGYGLLMTGAALFVKSKKPRGGAKNFFGLLLMCGISTIIFGVLTGGFFGDALTQFGIVLTHNKNYVFILPYKPLFDPINDIMLVLIGALIAGALHILFGMTINFVKQCMDGKVLDAIFDVGSWWVIFAGIALGALGITWIVAIIGVAMLVFTQGRGSKNIFLRLGSGLGALYNITGYLSDILSYARLMALMLAGSVIAKVFNTVGALTGNIVTFLLIFIIGHALNLGLNLLGCFVHDLRLQFLEFFGKFYQDGGRPFNPLKLNTKYVNIVNK
jgi:V/A-type H+-transporting ATPase subunit I